MKTYEMHYVGIGYPTKKEIEEKALTEGFTHSYWASEKGYGFPYNGDTVVVYNSTKDMPDGMKEDAEAFGRKI